MNINNAVTKILDIILPPRINSRIVSECKTSDLLKYYKPTTLQGIEYLLPYQETLVKALISEAKFHNNPKAHYLLNTLLTHHLDKKYDHLPILVPIPLSKQRQKQRGYNQVVSILTINPRIKKQIRMGLSKKIDTQPQTSLNRCSRKDNVIGVFVVDKSKIENYAAITVIDDVTTTGSTLREAQKTIERNLSTKIELLALAH